MDKDTKVKVRNTIVGSVTINLPNLNFTREWPRKDSVVMIPFSPPTRVLSACLASLALVLSVTHFPSYNWNSTPSKPVSFL